MSLTDDMAEVLDLALPPNARKVLEAAEAGGWEPNGKGTSLVIRLDHPTDPDAVPFFVSWLLYTSPEGKRSWRFYNAAAANLQSMSFKDVLTYLADPTVIWPEFPEEETA